MLRQRVVTALILAPVVLAGIFLLADLWFALFVGCFILVAGWEFAALCGLDGGARAAYPVVLALVMAGAWFLDHRLALAAGFLWWCVATALVILYPGAVRYWNGVAQLALAGVLTLVPAWIGLIDLKGYRDSNFLILLLLFLIWGADIGAYFAGRAFGVRKLAPAVSPGKSWAGFWGGLGLAAAVFVAVTYWGKLDLTPLRWSLFFALCMMVVVVSVIGDLTESMFKRNRGVKDSSQLLPGHGGFMDRMDSLVAAAPTFALALVVLGWQ